MSGLSVQLVSVRELGRGHSVGFDLLAEDVGIASTVNDGGNHQQLRTPLEGRFAKLGTRPLHTHMPKNTEGLSNESESSTKRTPPTPGALEGLAPTIERLRARGRLLEWGARGILVVVAVLFAAAGYVFIYAGKITARDVRELHLGPTLALSPPDFHFSSTNSPSNFPTNAATTRAYGVEMEYFRLRTEVQALRDEVGRLRQDLRRP